MHSLGCFSDKLTHDENTYFLQNIERYKERRIPFSALLTMLQSWIARFGEEYLRNQTLFEPFPEDLIELCRDTQCEWAGSESLKRDLKSATKVMKIGYLLSHCDQAAHLAIPFDLHCTRKKS
jgi:Protein of unknown function (DUF1722)